MKPKGSLETSNRHSLKYMNELSQTEQQPDELMTGLIVESMDVVQ